MSEVSERVEVPSLVEVEVSEKRRGRPRKAEAEVDVLESESKPATVEWGEVRFPLATGDAGYCARHVEMQLTSEQALRLKRLQIGLQMSGVTRGPRKLPVSSVADALKWFLEQQF